jgi:hypothetical protein
LVRGVLPGERIGLGERKPCLDPAYLAANGDDAARCELKDDPLGGGVTLGHDRMVSCLDDDAEIAQRA